MSQKNKIKYAPQERQSCWEYNKNSDSVMKPEVFMGISQQIWQVLKSLQLSVGERTLYRIWKESLGNYSNHDGIFWCNPELHRLLLNLWSVWLEDVGGSFHNWEIHTHTFSGVNIIWNNLLTVCSKLWGFRTVSWVLKAEIHFPSMTVAKQNSS